MAKLEMMSPGDCCKDYCIPDISAHDISKAEGERLLSVSLVLGDLRMDLEEQGIEPSEGLFGPPAKRSPVSRLKVWWNSK